jgi:plastocyanin
MRSHGGSGFRVAFIRRGSLPALRRGSSLALVGLCLAALGLTACGDDAKTPEAAAIDTAIRSTVDVTVSADGFDPATLAVESGTNIEFTVTDAARLTGVQDGTTVFDSGAQAAGDPYTWRADVVGAVELSATLAQAIPGAAPLTGTVTVTETPPRSG